MSKKNYFIGVDFGGTSIRAGVVDRKGQVLGFEKRKTQAELGTDVVFERLAVAVERAMRAADVKARDIGGIGIGVPGPIEQERGIVRVMVPWLIASSVALVCRRGSRTTSVSARSVSTTMARARACRTWWPCSLARVSAAASS
jgi:predicted NBD/HSP70 family sugar kinase